MLVLAQVSMPGTEIDTAGCVVFWVIATVDTADGQPAVVTTRLYVPGWLMVGLAVAPPDTMPGPLQA